MRFSDVPELDRPREKACHYGIETLTDAELLAILINNGYRGYSALDIATELLKQSKGLYNLNTLNQYDLKKIKGIKNVKSMQLMAFFEMMGRVKKRKIDTENRLIDSEYIFDKYYDYFRNSHTEAMVILVLNRNKRLIYETALYKGSSVLVSASTNEIIKSVILHDGYYFYLIHNHPHGSKIPSPQDVLLTIRLKESIKKMNIHLLDHIIIFKDGYTSMNNHLSKLKDEDNFLQIPA